MVTLGVFVIVIALLIQACPSSGITFPRAVDSNKQCRQQKHNIADPSFDIQTMRHNVIYNTLFFYQINEGDPGYQACYVNVYRSKNPTYDCSTIGLYNCVDTANHFLSSYATVNNSNGTVCYALSTYQDLETATFLIASKNCIVTSIVNIGNDPCAALTGSNSFTSVYC